MLLGEQYLPVKSDEEAPEFMNTLFFWRASSVTLSATAEFGTSTTASTLPWSNHSRVTTEPTSGLFWWSAETISAFTVPPAAR
jgi:hypothetical protein